MDEERRIQDLHVIPTLLFEIGTESSLRAIDTEPWKWDCAPVGPVGDHDCVSVCHAHAGECGRELVGEDGVVELWVNADGSRSAVQTPLHLFIHDTLKNLINITHLP